MRTSTGALRCVFVMSPNDHNGLDNRARVMVKVENDKWVLIK